MADTFYVGQPDYIDKLNIMAPYDIKGAFTVGDSTGTPTVVSPGVNGQVLSSDSTQASGLRWVALAGGGDMSLGAAQTVTGPKTFDNTTLKVNNTSNTFNSTLNSLATSNVTVSLPTVGGTIALLTTIDSGATFTDITTNNVSISRHGFVPKAPNVATQYLDGTGAWSTPAGGGATTWDTPGTIGSTTPNTGVFTTLSSSNSIATTGFGLNIDPTSSGTSRTYGLLRNIGGDFYIGKEGSVAGAFFTGANAYEDVLYSTGTVSTIITGVKRTTVSSTGLAVTGTLSATGAVTGTSFNSITGLSATLPLVAGTAAIGAGTSAARDNHVHPAQTTISGNAGTVTNATLTTALTVNTGMVTVSGNAANTSVLTLGAGASSISGTNTGDNAVNSNYASDYRAGNFTAGTQYVAPGAVTSNGVTMSTARILGRSTAATGAVEEISIGTNLTLSGGTLNATGSSMVYPAAGLAVSTGTAWGASLGAPTSGTILASVTAPATNPATGTPSSTTFLRGDGTWAAPAGGGDMVLNTTQTVSGAKTFLNGSLLLRNVANTISSLFSNVATIARTWTFPDKDGTVAMLSDITGTNSGTNTGDNAVNSNYSGLVTNATHTGEVTGAAALTITANAVTNAKLAQVSVNTIKGRITAGTGNTEDLTAANVRAIINVADGANNYVHTTNANLTGHITSVGNAAVLGSFTLAQLNTAISDADVATGGGTATGTNTGDNAVNSNYSGDYRLSNPPPLVTTTTNGYMSSTDKVKLNKVGVPLRITVMGDSISSPQTMRSQHWVGMLEMLLNQTGTNAIVTNLAIAGSTTNTMLTTVSFGANTMAQQCIASTPDIVIVMVGANDASGARTLVEIQGDITSLATTLRAGIPTAKLVFSSEILYDKTNFTAANAKLKGIIPLLQAYSLPSAGVTSGCYGTEMLNNVSGAPVLNILSRLDSFNTTATGLVQWDGLITHDHWKLARLGFMMYDGIHPNNTGMLYMATNILKGLSTLSFASTLYPGVTQQITNITSGLDTLFSKVLTLSGDGYTSVYNNVDGEDIALEQGILRSVHTDTWFYPYKTRCAMYPLSISYDASSTVYVSIDGGAPMLPVQISINEANFISTSISTDAYGRALAPFNGVYFGSPASYTIRIKVGIEIYGPYTQVITAATFVAGTNYVSPTGSDGIITRHMLRDTGFTFFDSNTTNALDYVNGSMQRWAPAVGAQSLTVTNWPPTGNLGELLIQGVNLGASTITWPAINWVTSTGAFTTTFSSNGVTLQTSGTDFIYLWTRDGGTTIYGKVVR